MTKADIVKQIARETGVEAVTVSAVVEEFMEQVRAAQIRKENVYLRGFGTFLIKSRKEKKGRDIRSEERRVGKECRSRWSPYH